MTLWQRLIATKTDIVLASFWGKKGRGDVAHFPDSVEINIISPIKKPDRHLLGIFPSHQRDELIMPLCQMSFYVMILAITNVLLRGHLIIYFYQMSNRSSFIQSPI